MLRLVHPPDGGQGTDPSRRRRRHTGVSDLTAEERRNLRQALHNLRIALGGWDVVGVVTGLTHHRLMRAAQSKRPAGTAGVALLAARAAGTTVEHILSGKLAPAGRCPTCGRSQDVGGGK